VDAGRVHEAHPIEIEDDRRHVGRRRDRERLLEQPRRGQVDLTLDRDDYHVFVLDDVDVYVRVVVHRGKCVPGDWRPAPPAGAHERDHLLGGSPHTCESTAD
jgi:hypothetical protein